MSDVCNDLFIIFEVHGQNLRLTKWAVRKELSTSESPSVFLSLLPVCLIFTSSLHLVISIQAHRKKPSSGRQA